MLFIIKYQLFLMLSINLIFIVFIFIHSIFSYFINPLLIHLYEHHIDPFISLKNIHAILSSFFIIISLSIFISSSSLTSLLLIFTSYHSIFSFAHSYISSFIIIIFFYSLPSLFIIISISPFIIIFLSLLIISHSLNQPTFFFFFILISILFIVNVYITLICSS